MKFFDSKRIPQLFKKQYMKIFAETVGGAVAVELLPTIVQTIGGYDETGKARINATGEVWDLGTGALGAAFFAGIGKPYISLGIGVMKTTKYVYKYVNPQIAKSLGTPLLPTTRYDVVSKTGLSQSTIADGEYKTVRLPDGTLSQVMVQPAAVSDSYVATPFMADGNAIDRDMYRLEDTYNSVPLEDEYTAVPLSDRYTGVPFSMSDDYETSNVIPIGTFEQMVAEDRWN